jgi:hypothetical protein
LELSEACNECDFVYLYEQGERYTGNTLSTVIDRVALECCVHEKGRFGLTEEEYNRVFALLSNADVDAAEEEEDVSSEEELEFELPQKKANVRNEKGTSERPHRSAASFFSILTRKVK